MKCLNSFSNLYVKVVAEEEEDPYAVKSAAFDYDEQPFSSTITAVSL